ncbi:hypothetical protein [Senegalia massiliensis]|uniref:hypothetical protein n=1 Tax=Senegalia massiliensis TaxID=1720316 RepID=UPI00102FD297|nr:hypothetical protein [Senegalia massiliensis]
MKVRDLVLIAILSATLTASKMALSFVPNVEIVTLLFIIYTAVFGFKKAILVSIIFSTTEIFLWGFNTWLIGYYLIWPILVVITSIISNKTQNEYIYAFLAGIFGLSFGLFFALTESVFYGVGYGITYWIRGLLFDIIHGFSNFILVLILFKPIKNIIEKQGARFN